jgi:hypothetical protein
MYGTYVKIMNKLYFNFCNTYLQGLLLILCLRETGRKWGLGKLTLSTLFIVAARSKLWVEDLLLAGIAGSNPP